MNPWLAEMSWCMVVLNKYLLNWEVMTVSTEAVAVGLEKKEQF